MGRGLRGARRVRRPQRRGQALQPGAREEQPERNHRRLHLLRHEARGRGSRGGAAGRLHRARLAREDDDRPAEEGVRRGKGGEARAPGLAQDRPGDAIVVATPTRAAQRLTLVRAEPSYSVLRAEGLMKRYRKRTVVSDVSLTVES